MVGLATAWHLQEHDIRVTVYERDHVGAGSSWGNAGWLTPALTAPLPEPAVLRYGVRAVVSPSSPVYVPLRPDPRLLRFLTGFARHSTERHWGRGMRAYAPMNRRALDAFDELTDNGVAATTRPADPFLAAFRTPDERAALVDELEHIQDAGQAVKYDLLTGHEARAIEPALSSAVGQSSACTTSATSTRRPLWESSLERSWTAAAGSSKARPSPASGRTTAAPTSPPATTSTAPTVTTPSCSPTALGSGASLASSAYGSPSRLAAVTPSAWPASTFRPRPCTSLPNESHARRSTAPTERGCASPG